MRKAFTLVELLVVIAIVALLISLLLPTLAKARDAGVRTQCASNQRGVGVGLLAYAADWNTTPTPHGQANFNPALVDWTSAPDRWGGWAGTGTWTEAYMYGTFAWWVGATTGDVQWYTNKSYACSAQLPFPYDAARGTAWQVRDNNASVTLASNIRGVNTLDPDTTRRFSTPWYVYMHPFTYNLYSFDWWDAGMAGNDMQSLMWGGPSLNQPSQYKLGQSSLGVPVIPGPRSGQLLRRPLATCPVASRFIPSMAYRETFEPHAEQVYTGNQNSRAANDPEAKNYLWTDGSVTYIYRR